MNRSRRAAVLPADTPDHSLRDTRDVSDLLADSINRLRRGELDPRVANAIGYLAGILLRALEQGPLEERLAHLEAVLGKSAPESQLFDFHAKEEGNDGQTSNAPNEN
jgi:hypothetical protein